MTVDNILEIYGDANTNDKSEGMCWYQFARKQCEWLAQEYGLELKRVVWAVAALSPMLKWERNIAAARAVIDGATRFPGVFSSNIEKAWHILHDEEDWERWLSGPKVNCFARNILGETDTVTVDTWAWRIWAGADYFAKPPNLNKSYEQIAEDYRQAAEILSIQPRQLQAITWVTFRRYANNGAAPGQLSLDI